MSNIARVIKNRIRDRIWDVVEEAIELGFDPEDFITEVRVSWWQARINQRNRDDKTFDDILKGIRDG